MNVRRIGFLATRTTNYQQIADFFREVLGLQTAWKNPTRQNDFVEIYEPAKHDANLLPDSADRPIVAFIVDDVVAARAEIVTTGIELLSEVI